MFWVFENFEFSLFLLLIWILDINQFSFRLLQNGKFLINEVKIYFEKNIKLFGKKIYVLVKLEFLNIINTLLWNSWNTKNWMNNYDEELYLEQLLILVNFLLYLNKTDIYPLLTKISSHIWSNLLIVAKIFFCRFFY